MALIDERGAMTGRQIKEDSTTVNVAELTETLQKALTFRPTLFADETINDSDKSFVVTAAKEWRLDSIWVELATTVTVGNRQIAIEIQDGAADVIARFPAGATQAASLSVNYVFGGALAAQTAAVAGVIMTPLPPLVLPAAWTVRVYDTAAVAPAADDMVVQLLVGERAAP